MLEEVNLSARDRALYEKLYASIGDIATAQCCARFILKKGWHSASFFRRGSVPVQQVALTTTMIVAYCRPFAKGRDAASLNFPNRLLQYDSEQRIFHSRLLTLRHTQYAHSDSATIKVKPLKGDNVRSIDTLRDVHFSASELLKFLGMTGGVINRAQDRIEEIRRSGF